MFKLIETKIFFDSLKLLFQNRIVNTNDGSFFNIFFCGSDCSSNACI